MAILALPEPHPMPDATSGQKVMTQPVELAEAEEAGLPPPGAALDITESLGTEMRPPPFARSPPVLCSRQTSGIRKGKPQTC